MAQQQEPETRDATATTVGAIKKALHQYLEEQYRYYCNEIRRGRGAQLLKPITQDYLAECIGKSKARVSALLELKVPIDRCKNIEIRAMREASHDIEKMVAYGQKHWGRKNRVA